MNPGCLINKVTGRSCGCSTFSPIFVLRSYATNNHYKSENDICLLLLTTIVALTTCIWHCCCKMQCTKQLDPWMCYTVLCFYVAFSNICSFPLSLKRSFAYIVIQETDYMACTKTLHTGQLQQHALSFFVECNLTGTWYIKWSVTNLRHEWKSSNLQTLTLRNTALSVPR